MNVEQMMAAAASSAGMRGWWQSWLLTGAVVGAIALFAWAMETLRETSPATFRAVTRMLLGLLAVAALALAAMQA